MKKFRILMVLMSFLTLVVLSGCSDSSSSGGIVIPPASDTKVGLYTIEKIVSKSGVTQPFDTSRLEQVLYFNGEMVIANATLKIEGKYQVIGYAEFANRPPTPAGKYITYNKFSADNATAANMTLVPSTDGKKRYTLQVTDNANIALELTVVQTNNSSLASINYQPWVAPATDGLPAGGNPYFSNNGFNYLHSGNLEPTYLIGNYMIKKVVIEKNGQTVTVDNNMDAKNLVGELSVTARTSANSVLLNIAVKLQTDPALIAGTNFADFIIKKDITDTIPLDFPLNELSQKLPGIFANEGMVMVSGSSTDIIYSPKKRNPDNTFSDLQIDGAKVTFTLSKIINGGLLSPTPAKPLTDPRYW